MDGTDTDLASIRTELYDKCQIPLPGKCNTPLVSELGTTNSTRNFFKNNGSSATDVYAHFLYDSSTYNWKSDLKLVPNSYFQTANNAYPLQFTPSSRKFVAGIKYYNFITSYYASNPSIATNFTIPETLDLVNCVDLDNRFRLKSYWFSASLAGDESLDIKLTSSSISRTAFQLVGPTGNVIQCKTGPLSSTLNYNTISYPNNTSSTVNLKILVNAPYDSWWNLDTSKTVPR